MSTTIPISGLHHAACLLATPGFVRPLAGRHAGSLLTGWLGVSQVGLEPEVLTYWVTTTNFIGFLLLPRFRAYLGASKRQAAGGFVLLSHVPTVGAMAHRARAVLQAYKEQHGREQNYGCLKDPLIGNSLFLNQPERIEALGLVFLLALLVGRLVESTLRVHVETTGNPFTGWDKQITQKPMAFLMRTKFAAVIVLQVGSQRQLAQPLSPLPQPDLLALGSPATYCTGPQSG